MILEDLKAYLIINSLTTNAQVAFNYCGAEEHCVVLTLHGGTPSMAGIQSKVFDIQIKVVDIDQEVGLIMITAIYDSLINAKRFVVINDKKTNVYPNQLPFFIERDAQNRYVHAFSITIVAMR